MYYQDSPIVLLSTLPLIIGSMALPRALEANGNIIAYLVLLSASLCLSLAGFCISEDNSKVGFYLCLTAIALSVLVFILLNQWTGFAFFITFYGVAIAVAALNS